MFIIMQMYKVSRGRWIKKILYQTHLNEHSIVSKKNKINVI